MDVDIQESVVWELASADFYRKFVGGFSVEIHWFLEEESISVVFLVSAMRWAGE